jgi:hypothetical protein
MTELLLCLIEILLSFPKPEDTRRRDNVNVWEILGKDYVLPLGNIRVCVQQADGLLTSRILDLRGKVLNGGVTQMMEEHTPK